MVNNSSVSYFRLKIVNTCRVFFAMVYNQLGIVSKGFHVKFRKAASGKPLNHFCHFVYFALQSLFVGQLDHTGYLNRHLGVPNQMALCGQRGGDRRPLMVDHQIAINQRNFILMG